MKADIELNYVAADLVVLDYSDCTVDFIDLPEHLEADDVQSEEIEEYLENALNYKLSQISWMKSSSPIFPINYRTTL